MSDFRCPRCKAELLVKTAEQELCCSGCGAPYSVRNGIFDFRYQRMDYYFNPVPRVAMAELIKDASYESWPRIIWRFMEYVNYNPDWLNNLISDGRYTWKLFLELPPDTKFLDLGCGLGNLTKNIAPHVGRTFALDLTWERLEFAKRRFELFNPDDNIVLVAGGDGRYLPFPDNFFDCVALSGVLEWVADTGEWESGKSKLSRGLRMIMSFFGDTNPRTMQLKFLQEIHRILKPNGQIFVAIENRLNYEYFVNRPDHHSQLWYGSLLPRFVANLYSIAVSKKPYRTYTYSLGGYRKLFRRAGFTHQQFFGFFQGYTHLSEAIPLQGNDNLWHLSRPQRFKDIIKKNKHFVPAYGIIASSSRLQQSLLKRIITSLERDVPMEWTPVSVIACQITGKEKVILHGQAGMHPIIIKIPLNHSAAAAEERHHHFLKHAMTLNGLDTIVPEPLTCGEVQNVVYYAEKKLAGQPLKEKLVSCGRSTLIQGVFNLLCMLNPTIQEKAPVLLADGYFHSEVEKPLAKLFKVIDDPGLARETHNLFHQHLYGIPIRCGILHGDFSVNNIFSCDGKISGLIDWEDVHNTGLPILDVLNYLESVHRFFNPQMTLADTITLLASGHWPVEQEYRFLQESYKFLGLNPQYHAGFTYLRWLYHLVQQLNFTLIYDRPMIKEKIELALRGFLNNPVTRATSD